MRDDNETVQLCEQLTVRQPQPPCPAVLCGWRGPAPSWGCARGASSAAGTATPGTATASPVPQGQLQLGLPRGSRDSPERATHQTYGAKGSK